MKNKLTKISALLLSIFIVFSLSACGLNDISNTVDKIEDFESSIENNDSGENNKNNNASSETFNLDEIPDFHKTFLEFFSLASLRFTKGRWGVKFRGIEKRHKNV